MEIGDFDRVMVYDSDMAFRNTIKVLLRWSKAINLVQLTNPSAS